MSDLRESKWVLISASAHNLLWYSLLMEVYKENPASLRYVVGERRDTLIAFSENCGFSSLILHQNLTNDSFLKASCDVGFETISINVILCYMRIHWSVLNFEWIFFTHHDSVISHIGPTESLIHWVRQIFEMLTFFIVHCQKTHLLISLLILTEKS